jgi:carbamoyltransferase
MNILGISGLYHDSAAALIIDGKVVAAAQEERFTRVKHDNLFPVHSIRYCLEEGNMQIDDLDAVVYYEKPGLRYDRYMESYTYFAPSGFKSFLAHFPILFKWKHFFNNKIKKHLREVHPYDASALKILYTEHHLSHAAGAYYPSGFDDAAILTIDGVGEYASASICHGKNNKIKILKELRWPHSLGILYSAFTQFLGFKINNGEYKVMGLAPYGIVDSEEVNRFIKVVKDRLIDIAEDGSIWLNQEHFQYATASGGKIKIDHWEKILDMKMRPADSNLEQTHCNLALAIQLITEESVLKMAAEAKRLTGSKNICLSGGVALNCVANGKLLKSKMFDHIFIQPAAGDAGGAVGAGLAAHHIYFDQALKKIENQENVYLGPEFSDEDIEAVVAKHETACRQFDNDQSLCDKVASLIASDNVIGWYQGRMEFGPRALGNRSILGNATSLDMQRKINLKIKFREGFRPFAPSVLLEDNQKYFNIDRESPYMLLVTDVQKDVMRPLPDGYDQMHWRDKLDVNRSEIQAVTHVNFSARVQTVTPKSNAKYYQLIKSFKQLTGYGLLINTSFNVRGEPIVCTPQDAYNCFMQTNMDYLVLNNYVFSKHKNDVYLEALQNSHIAENTINK